ncbi:hypothetical protein EIP91_007477 [Steccherinum ochraceum]|uniref:Uncharacterized protein n=1 Tax=Steccherinum ochraceum TaxID=92696 RepID=A0A4R0R4C9_9APHY|nr:hypothetical protein EIP91_007477 [Steccherinum ochraceum]
MLSFKAYLTLFTILCTILALARAAPSNEKRGGHVVPVTSENVGTGLHEPTAAKHALPPMDIEG